MFSDGARLVKDYENIQHLYSYVHDSTPRVHGNTVDLFTTIPTFLGGVKPPGNPVIWVQNHLPPTFWGTKTPPSTHILGDESTCHPHFWGTKTPPYTQILGSENTLHPRFWESKPFSPMFQGVKTVGTQVFGGKLPSHARFRGVKTFGTHVMASMFWGYKPSSPTF